MRGIFAQFLSGRPNFFGEFLTGHRGFFRSLTVGFADFLLGALKNLTFAEDFLCRIDFDRLQSFQRTLAVDIKGANRIYLRAKKLDAIRGFAIRRVDIQDSAAHAELPARVDHFPAFIAQRHQLAFDFVQIDFFPKTQSERGFFEAAVRRDFFDGSGSRRDDDHRLTGTQRLERSQAGKHVILIFGRIAQQELFFLRQGNDFLVLYKKRKI